MEVDKTEDNNKFLTPLNINRTNNENMSTETNENNKINLKGKYYESQKNNSTSSSPQEFENTYDINISFTIVNFRSINASYKEVKLGEILKKEIPLNTFFYTSFLRNRSEVTIVIEFTIKKNYNFNVGFTGIVNEAMTCYMNSMLQTLNILGYFKKAVFQIPTEENENRSMSVSYSLQRLFYDLMNESQPISTNRLIYSFGWTRDMIFIQHDVQEFNLLLSDIMEKKMKGTKAEGTFKFLFEGKSLNYIKCIDVDYNSIKEEYYYDLQLTIKGCKNIYESLNKYTEEEILDNEDKYEAEGYGKQKAKKGASFINFPPVLILQLKRFEYNPKKDSMDKINDTFEFYEEINLNQYIHDNKDEWTYSLHSIVVHKGNINNGHYFAFIRPSLDNKWYNFNDEYVRQADLFEVFQNNYGGTQKIYKHKDRGNIIDFNQKWDANAYILVYIRNSMRELILSPVNDVDVLL
jgi:ubiquitin carboxyl-terminal hydrolase 7